MQALATKYRPVTFDEILGQKSIIKILKRQLELNQFLNCYLFCGPSGDGKAQPLTSKVYTKYGFKTMGEITVGDIILDGCGNETKVLGVYPQGERDIYKITLSDGSSFEVADNHLNVVYRNNTDHKQVEKLTLNTIQLKTMLESDEYKNRYPLFIPVNTLDCWEDKNIDIDPYLLGALIGDGSLSNKNMSFSTKDLELINKLNTILDRDFKLSLKHVTQYDYAISSNDKSKYIFEYDNNVFNSCESMQTYLINKGYPRFDSKSIIRIAQNKASTLLKKYPELRNSISVKINENYGVNRLKTLLRNYKLNVTSDKKFIPDNYLYSSLTTRKLLLQGLLDTDGTISKNVTSPFTRKNIGGRIFFTTTSYILKENVAFLCRSLGYIVRESLSKQKSYIYTYKGIEERRPCKQSYTLSIIPKEEDEVFSLARKRDRLCEHRFEPRRKIISIEFVRKDLCQCIYVESDEHTYLTDNLTVTHNTTTARAFARYINNNKGEPIEIDGASNNGVDNVKAIIKSANERSVDSEYKIYIIDECHSLTNQAWQAFLKCIEEPPRFTIFIFCTTDPQKIPQTILNRVQRFNFTRLSQDEIKSRLEYVCRCEGFTNYSEAIDFISKIANGGMRDALAYLDKVSAYDTNLSINNVLEALGNYSYETFFELTNALIDGKEDIIINIIDSFFNEGKDLKLFTEQYLDFCLDLSKYCLFKDMSVTRLPVSLEKQVVYCTGIENNKKYFNKLVDKMLDIKNLIKTDNTPKITITIMLLQFTRG